EADGAAGRRRHVAGGDGQIAQAEVGQPLEHADHAVEGGVGVAVEVGDRLLNQAALQDVLQDRPSGGVADGGVPAHAGRPGEALLQARLDRGGLAAVETSRDGSHGGGGKGGVCGVPRGVGVQDVVGAFAVVGENQILPVRVEDPVDLRAAVEVVHTGAAIQVVHAVAAFEGVGAFIAVEVIVIGTAGEEVVPFAAQQDVVAVA